MERASKIVRFAMFINKDLPWTEKIIIRHFISFYETNETARMEILKIALDGDSDSGFAGSHRVEIHLG